MRLLTVPFLSSAEFLSHYSSKHADGALFCRTRTELSEGEQVLVEISFPGLPNRSLLRASVLSIEGGKGVWLTLAPEDASTRDFLVGLARGEIEVNPVTERSHSRFPAQLPVAFRISGQSDALTPAHAAVDEVQTGDVSASGAFIRTQAAPSIGSRVELVIDAGDGAGRFTLEGEVTWSGRDGFGVHFRDKRADDARRLRALLRRASECGRVRFAELSN